MNSFFGFSLSPGESPCLLVLVGVLTNFVGYPFTWKVSCKCSSSGPSLSSSQMLHALCLRHEIMPVFTLGWWCELYWRYWSMCVCFWYTDVTSTNTPRKGSWPFCPISIVNLMGSCMLFRCSRKDSSLSWPCWQITNVSLTYLTQLKFRLVQGSFYTHAFGESV